ncbi:hypothetical protein WISP_31173 [Willisornis vidua]|uniref:Uncharacterized protein n=1 Tax=Willisornis vidua TaxID=1566151 RepID=A0ABQ9DK12_9PASS|nr:hypothetical protein WISP_31173 [Willisornis vidua]
MRGEKPGDAAPGAALIHMLKQGFLEQAWCVWNTQTLADPSGATLGSGLKDSLAVPPCQVPPLNRSSTTFTTFIKRYAVVEQSIGLSTGEDEDKWLQLSRDLDYGINGLF